MAFTVNFPVDTGTFVITDYNKFNPFGYFIQYSNVRYI